MDNRERLKIVIMQMLEHNETHVEKYEKWADFAKRISWLMKALF